MTNWYNGRPVDFYVGKNLYETDTRKMKIHCEKELRASKIFESKNNPTQLFCRIINGVFYSGSDTQLV